MLFRSLFIFVTLCGSVYLLFLYIKEAKENNAAEILPQKWYWPLLGLQSVACLGIGYTVTRMAPFAKFAHCVFLAMILCVSFLQSAVAAPAPIQWMHIGLMAATPIATLLGGKIYLSTVKTVSPENADH